VKMSRTAPVQIFALDGRGRVTSRIYPLGTTNSWGVAAFGLLGSQPASAAVSVWELGPAFNSSDASACC
jgi:hypothetical protein